MQNMNETGNNSYNLERFIQAQNQTYETALQEIRNGQKLSHWMWYIFPQIQGLGRSSTAVYYAIQDAAEARAYMENDMLREHLLEISEALLQTASTDARNVMGSPDDMKLKSCMTLFDAVAPEYSVFQKVLDKFFSGKKDRRTMAILERVSC